MEVSFSAELEAKLARLAARWVRDSQALVVEAVERLVDYNEWFQAEVEKGEAAEEAQEIDRDRENT